MEFQRARSEEQKNIRRDQIIEATLKLYERIPLEKITLASIAKELNFSRVNLYKYVTTKEEIFLWILTSDLEKWVKQVYKRFEEYDKLDLKTFCHLWADEMKKNKRLIRLISKLSFVLKNNIPKESLKIFKEDLYNNFKGLNFIVKKFIPNLSDEQVLTFLEYQLYYPMGLYPLAVAYETGCSEFDTDELLSNKLHKFVSEFPAYLEVILLGLQEKNQ